MSQEQIHKRLRSLGGYSAALAIFLSSRLTMAVAIFFAARFLPQNPVGEFWNVNNSWYHYLLRYDSGWYLRILREGYTYNGDNLAEHPVVFFPLYPLLSRALKIIFGLDQNVAVLVVSNLSILVAVPLFFKLVKEEYETETALFSVAFLSYFPTSFFFSAGYTESLAFLLTVAFFLLLKRERFILAALFAGLTLATRPTGIVLLLPLLWEIFRAHRVDIKRFIFNSILCDVIATSGLLLYMLYLWLAFQSPLAFLHAQQAWQNGQSLSANLAQALTLRSLHYLNLLFYFGPNPNTLDPWFFLLSLLVIILFRKHLRTSYTLYAFAILLLPYLTVSESIGFRSFTRYALLAFPVFIALGHLTRKMTWAGLSLLGLNAAILFMYTAMFAEWYWAG